MSDISDQLVPFQDSALAVKLGGALDPPKLIADPDVPAAPLAEREVPKSLTSVQLVPLKDSVNVIEAGPGGPASPPIASAAV